MERSLLPVIAREQAEAWFARLMASDCSEHERESFARWRAEPGNADAYAATERLLSGVDALAADPRMAMLMRQARANRTRPAFGQGRRWGWMAAAGVFLSVAAALRFGSGLWAGPEPVTYVATDEGRTVVLEDGSIVRLDIHSRLAERFDRRRRDIELVTGRTAFEVAHDASRPFVVRAGDGSVTALGTHFQVRRERGDVIVTLVEGSVAVARPAHGGSHRSLRLQPGQELHWSGEDAWRVRAVDAEAALGWTQGRLVFRGTRLAEVVSEVNRYSARKLLLADPNLGDLPVHGNFIAGDAEAVSAALGAVLPVRIAPDGNAIRISRR